jgi:hypothetical protein
MCIQIKHSKIQIKPMIKSSNIILAFYPRSVGHITTRKSELFPCCSIESNKKNPDLWVTLPEEIKGKKNEIKVTSAVGVVALGVASVRPGGQISFGGANCILWATLSSSSGGVDESGWLSVAAVVSGGGGRT